MSDSTDVDIDYSEWSEGPSLIAIRGEDKPNNQYRLGTREYDWHHHVRGQLLCVDTGFIEVKTSHGSWLLPPSRASWIPPSVSHKIKVSGALSGWTLFMTPILCSDLPQYPCVIGISELLRALAKRASEWNKLSDLALDQKHIIAVIQDEIRLSPHEALHLPMPQDPRLERVLRTMLAEPDCQRSLDEWASYGAMSSRTLRRLILAETGLSFAQWRQQAQLKHSLELLARGTSVAEVSEVLGYTSPSSFIAMFRKALGDPPARYFSKRRLP